MHRNYNAAQSSTRLEKHHASPLNKSCNYLDGLTPGTHCVSSLCIINHSDDILPSQVPFQDEHGNDFCTKINLLDKYTPEEKRKEYEYRTHTIKWVITDAHHVGYDKYGKHPQTYWNPLIKDVYESN